MKTKKIERYEEVSVLLECGIDYQEGQLQGDALTGHRLKNLSHGALTNIATANGFTSVMWSDFEHDGTVKAVFRKDLYL